MSDLIVRADNLSKRFKIYSRRWHRASEWISLGRVRRHSEFWALREVTFEVRKGECLGIIGPNGAGKSTLLKILSRALYPTTGAFAVAGRAVSLLELGTGFHPELTGRQNIFNSARLLGFDERFVRERLPAIAAFSELGDFLDRPIHTYSSGMYVRLAFSLFASLDPDVYIIDEALAVGDASFQKKCVDRINEMRQNGVTILFVSHDLWRVEALCNRVLYLDHGRIRRLGLPRSVIQRYVDDTREKAAGDSADEPGESLASDAAGASKRILATQFEMYAHSPLKIRRFWVMDERGQERTEFQAHENFSVALEYVCSEPIREPVFRVVFGLPDERRVAAVGWHPERDRNLEAGTGILHWKIQGGTLFSRKYVLHASVSSWDGVVYDTHYGVGRLKVTADDSGPVFRVTDDLAAFLDFSVTHTEDRKGDE